MEPGRASHVSCHMSIILSLMSAAIASRGYGSGDGWAGGDDGSHVLVIETANGLGRVEKDFQF